MSNTLPTSSVNTADRKQFKKDFVELIANGFIEVKALQQLNMNKGIYIRYCMEDPDFVKAIEEARKHRADFWVSKIAENIDVIPETSEVAGEKFRFEKLCFLAKADNPERYGNNSKSKVDISLDLKQFKLLAPDAAVKALASDPFATVIDAEFTESKEEDLL